MYSRRRCVSSASRQAAFEELISPGKLDKANYNASRESRRRCRSYPRPSCPVKWFPPAVLCAERSRAGSRLQFHLSCLCNEVEDKRPRQEQPLAVRLFIGTLIARMAHIHARVVQTVGPCGHRYSHLPIVVRSNFGSYFLSRRDSRFLRVPRLGDRLLYTLVHSFSSRKNRQCLMNIKYSNLSPMTNDRRDRSRNTLYQSFARDLRKADITPATRLELSPGRINLRTDKSLALSSRC